MKVYKGKYGWYTVFHGKLQNGEDLKFNMSVQFMRGREPEKESIDIETLRWWGNCYLSNKDGKVYPKLFIADYREIEKAEDGFIASDFKPETMTEYLQREEPLEELTIDTEDLPFF